MNDGGRGVLAGAHIAEEEVGKAEADVSGIDSAGRHLTLGCGEVKEIVAGVAVFIAEFEAVISLQPTQGVDELPGLRDLELRAEGRGAEAGQAGDVNGRNAGVVGAGRDAGESVIGGEGLAAFEADHAAVGVVAAEAGAELVEGGGADDVGPGEGDGLAADDVLGGEVAVACDGVAGPGRVLAVDLEVAEAAENAAIRREVVIDSGVEGRGVGRDGVLELIVGGAGPTAGLAEASDGGGEIGKRIERSEFDGYGVDAVGGNDVRGDASGLAGDFGIGEGGPEFGEVSGLHERGGNGGKDGGGLADSEILHVEKKEGFVFDDGAADGAAVLVLAEVAARNAAGVIEERVGVEFIIAEEFPDIAVELVGAAFDRGVDDGSGGGSELSGIGAGLNTEFL